MIDRCQCDDWQVYEDSVELQSFFIQQRDELCDDWQVSESWLTGVSDDWQVSVCCLTGLWRLSRVTVVLHSTAWRAVWWLTGASVMIDRCQCNVWQVYEDSVELQSFFIQQRDELCDDWQVSVWWLTGLWRLCRITVVLHSTAWRAVWWLTGVSVVIDSVMIDRSMKTQ